MKSHGPYAMKFFFCELLCLINVIGQMYFTDRFTSSQFASFINIVIFNTSRFLGYTFMTYGSDVFAMTFGNPEGRSDPMNMVFPKVTMTMLTMMAMMEMITVIMVIGGNDVNDNSYRPHEHGLPQGDNDDDGGSDNNNDNDNDDNNDEHFR